MANTGFEGLLAQYYDQLFGVSTAEVAVHTTLLKNVDGPILEVGSGTGQLLIPLLAKGYTIEGVEPSAAMNAQCNQKARALNLDPTIHHCALMELEKPHYYDAIIMPSGVFQLMAAATEPQEIVAYLRKLLKVGGLLVIDVMKMDTPIEGQVLAVIHEDDAIVEVEVSSSHRVTSTFELTYTFTKCIASMKEEIVSTTLTWQRYTIHQLQQLVCQWGFADSRKIQGTIKGLAGLFCARATD